MVIPQLTPRHTMSARAENMSGGASHYRLTIPAGNADAYRLAQLDDYQLTPRQHFPHRSPLRLSLSGRVSNASLPGTWGFGLWNDPFGLSLGFGGSSFRLPALPNAVWFFGASEENHLSFKSSPPEQSRAHSQGASTAGVINAPASVPRVAANGFIAQSFRAPRFHPLLIPAGLAFPFSRKVMRRLLSHVIAEEGIELGVDPTDWHRYRLEWSPDQVSFEVDEVQVFESAVSPDPPLGLVIWIDNQYAAFTPEGKIGFGVLENPEPAWLEVNDVEVLNN